MSQSNYQEKLQQLGYHMLKCMAIQATVRTTGEASFEAENEYAREMVNATRIAAKICREMWAGSVPPNLITGQAAKVTDVITVINDGAFSMALQKHELVS
jgi:hypothetical protein